MGIGRPFRCLPANFVKLRQVLILALDFSSGPLTNFKGTFHKIPCSHSPLKVVIMSQKWLPLTLNKYCYVGSIWPWPIPIALPNSVKRIQGSESQYLLASTVIYYFAVSSRWSFLEDFAQ